MITNSIKNQAMDYKSLRNLYIKQNRLNDAEAFFQKALEFYKEANAVIGRKNASKKLKKVHKMLDERAHQINKVWRKGWP